MKKALLPIVFFGLVCLALSPALAELTTRRIRIGNQVFTIELAVEAADIRLGLGQRDEMAEDQGMLFLFQDKGRHSFWMKGMRFPLDFLWIDGQTIVEITRSVSVPVPGPMRSFWPDHPVDRVLELNAGTADKYGISIGDVIRFLD